MNKLATCAAIAALLLPFHPGAEAQSPTDVAIKAKLVLAVARFAEMPEPLLSGPLRFCVTRKTDDIPRAFRELNGQQINKRIVEVVAVTPAGGCDVLFVDASLPGWRGLLALQSDAVLTIGDVPGFLVNGGMIEFVMENDSVRFDVNITAVRKQGIRLPAQVLKLARQIKE